MGAVQLCLGPCEDVLLSQLDGDSEGELDEEGDSEVYGDVLER